MRLDAQRRREAAATSGEDAAGESDGYDPDAALALHLEALERTEARAGAAAGVELMQPSTSCNGGGGGGGGAATMQPTAAQQRVMSGLLSRGRVGGWIVEPSEVRGEGGGRCVL